MFRIFVIGPREREAKVHLGPTSLSFAIFLWVSVTVKDIQSRGVPLEDRAAWIGRNLIGRSTSDESKNLFWNRFWSHFSQSTVSSEVNL